MSTHGTEYKNIDRAAYELPWLLKRLGDVDRATPLTPEQRLIVQAAEGHAYVANDNLMRGFEAIGKLLFTAGTNKDWPLDSRQLSDVGTLLSHLAVEGQYLQETEAEMRDMLLADENRPHEPAPASSAGRRGGAS